MNSQSLNIKIKELSKINNVKALRALLIDWIIVFSTIYLVMDSNSLLLQIFAIIIIGSRQHALGILSHDAVHYRFLTNKKANEIVGNLFTAFPLFITIPGFRSMHLRHHSNVNSEDDPDWVRRKGKADWVFPMSRSKLYMMLFMDITGLNLYQNIQKIFLPKSDKKLKKDFQSLPASFYVAQVSFYIIIFGLITKYELWSTYFLFWIVPYFTWFKFIKRLRAIGEHFAIEDNGYKELTRTTLVGFLEKHLVSPHNINYHIEHHRYASIPYYNLEKLHDLLMNSGRLQTMGKVQIDGYLLGVLRETSGECSLNKKKAPDVQEPLYI